MKTQSFKTKGFSLVELVVTIAIIGIMAAMVAPNFMSSQRTAQQKAAQSACDVLDLAKASFLQEYGAEARERWFTEGTNNESKFDLLEKYLREKKNYLNYSNASRTNLDSSAPEGADPFEIYSPFKKYAYQLNGISDRTTLLDEKGNPIGADSGVDYYMVSLDRDPAQKGSVSGAGTYPDGSTVRITASAFAGYKFDKWTPGDITSPSHEFTLSANKTFTAHFSGDGSTDDKLFTLYTNSNVKGCTVSQTGGDTPIDGQYEDGDSVTLTASPDTGYTFKEWRGTETGSGTSISFNMDQNYNMTAIFEREKATVGVTADVGGSVFSPGDRPVYLNQDTAISATADPDYEFNTWTSTGSVAFADAAEPTTTFQVTSGSSATVTATFAARTGYTVTADPGHADAYVVVDNEKAALNTAKVSGSRYEGELVTVSVVLPADRQFIGWQHPTDGNQLFDDGVGGTSGASVASPSSKTTSIQLGSADISIKAVSMANDDYFPDGGSTTPLPDDHLYITIPVRTEANDAKFGTVKPDGLYKYERVNFTAYPAQNYKFIEWFWIDSTKDVGETGGVSRGEPGHYLLSFDNIAAAENIDGLSAAKKTALQEAFLPHRYEPNFSYRITSDGSPSSGIYLMGWFKFSQSVHIKSIYIGSSLHGADVGNNDTDIIITRNNHGVEVWDPLMDDVDNHQRGKLLRRIGMTYIYHPWGMDMRPGTTEFAVANHGHDRIERMASHGAILGDTWGGSGNTSGPTSSGSDHGLGYRTNDAKDGSTSGKDPNVNARGTDPLFPPNHAWVDNPHDVAYSRDGQYLYAVAYDERRIIKFDLEYRRVAEFDFGSVMGGTPTGVCTVDDGKVVVADYNRQTISIFDADLNWLYDIGNPRFDYPRHLTFLGDKSQFILTCYDRGDNERINFHDPEGGARRRYFVPTGRPMSSCLSSDDLGCILYSDSYNSNVIDVWDLSDDTKLSNIKPAAPDPIFSNPGYMDMKREDFSEFAVPQYSNYNIHIFDNAHPESSRPKRVLNQPNMSNPRHCSLSPDRERLWIPMTGDNNSPLRVYHADGGAITRSYPRVSTSYSSFRGVAVQGTGKGQAFYTTYSGGPNGTNDSSVAQAPSPTVFASRLQKRKRTDSIFDATDGEVLAEWHSDLMQDPCQLQMAFDQQNLYSANWSSYNATEHDPDTLEMTGIYGNPDLSNLRYGNFNADHTEIWAACYSTYRIRVLNAEGGKVIKDIRPHYEILNGVPKSPTAYRPFSVAKHPTEDVMYVVDYANNYLRKHSSKPPYREIVEDNYPIYLRDALPEGQDHTVYPQDVELTKDGSKIYVSTYGRHYSSYYREAHIRVYNTADGSFDRFIGTPWLVEPYKPYFDPNTNDLLIPDMWGSSLDLIHRLHPGDADGDTGGAHLGWFQMNKNRTATLGTPPDTNPNPIALVKNPESEEYYVAHNNGNKVTVWKKLAQTREEFTETFCSWSNGQPQDVAIHKEGGKWMLYVVWRYGDNSGRYGRCVAVYDTQTKALVRTMGNAMYYNPRGMDKHPTKSEFAVANYSADNNHKVLIQDLNGATLKMLSNSGNHSIMDVCYWPDGSRLLALAYYNNGGRVYVYDTSDYSEIQVLNYTSGSYSTGRMDYATALAVRPGTNELWVANSESDDVKCYDFTISGGNHAGNFKRRIAFDHSYRNPLGICFGRDPGDSEDWLYVACYGYSRDYNGHQYIKVYNGLDFVSEVVEDAASEATHLVTELEPTVLNTYGIRNPAEVEIAKNGQLLIYSWHSHNSRPARIHRFYYNSGGGTLDLISDGNINPICTYGSQSFLRDPCGFYDADTDRVYVSFQNEDSLGAWDYDTGNLVFDLRTNDNNNADDELGDPRSIDFSSDDAYFYVGDYQNSRVRKYKINGEPVESFNALGTTTSNPMDLVVDKAVGATKDYIYVVQNNTNTPVTVLEPTGVQHTFATPAGQDKPFARYVGNGGNAALTEEHLWFRYELSNAPRGIAINPLNNYLYIVNYNGSYSFYTVWDKSGNFVNRSMQRNWNNINGRGVALSTDDKRVAMAFNYYGRFGIFDSITGEYEVRIDDAYKGVSNANGEVDNHANGGDSAMDSAFFDGNKKLVTGCGSNYFMAFNVDTADPGKQYGRWIMDVVSNSAPNTDNLGYAWNRINNTYSVLVSKDKSYKDDDGDDSHGVFLLNYGSSSITRYTINEDKARFDFDYHIKQYLGRTSGVAVRPYDVDTGSDSREVFVTSYDANAVVVFDRDTGKYLRSIRHAVTSSMNDPRALAFNDDGTKFYAALYGGNRFCWYDATADGSVYGFFGEHQDPTDANGDGTAYVYDGEGVVTDTYMTGVMSNPIGVAYRDDEQVYLANYGGNTVSVVDTTHTNPHVAYQWQKKFNNPWGSAYRPGTDELYVSNNTNYLYVFNHDTGRLLRYKQYDSGNHFRNGGGLRFDQTGKYLFASIQYSSWRNTKHTMIVDAENSDTFYKHLAAQCNNWMGVGDFEVDYEDEGSKEDVVYFSPDNSSGWFNAGVRVWKPFKASPYVRELKRRLNRPYKVTWRPNTRQVWCSSYHDTQLQAYNLDHGGYLGEIPAAGLFSNPNDLCFNTEGSWIYLNNYGTGKLNAYEFTDHDPDTNPDTMNQAFRWQVGPYLTDYHDPTYNTPNGHTAHNERLAWLSGLAYDTINDRLYAGNGYFASGYQGHISILSLESGKHGQRIYNIRNPLYHTMHHAVQYPKKVGGRNILFVADWNNLYGVKWFDYDTGEWLGYYRVPVTAGSTNWGNCFALEFSKDGSELYLSMYNNGHIKVLEPFGQNGVYDPTYGTMKYDAKEIRRVPPEGESIPGYPSYMALNPTETELWVTTYNTEPRVRVFQPQVGIELDSKAITTNYTHSLGIALLPDETEVFVGFYNSKGVRVFHPETGGIMRDFNFKLSTGHGTWNYGLDVDSSGTYVYEIDHSKNRLNVFGQDRSTD